MTSCQSPATARRTPRYAGSANASRMIVPQRGRSSMVSNSGTTLIASSAPRHASPTSFSSSADLEQVGHRLALRNDVVLECVVTVCAMHVGGRPHDGELALRCAPNSQGAASAAGAALASSRGQQRDALRLGQRQHSRRRPGAREELGHGPLVHVGSSGAGRWCARWKPNTSTACRSGSSLRTRQRALRRASRATPLWCRGRREIPRGVG